MKTVIASNGSLLTILRSRSAFILIALALGAFALSPRVRPVNPPPDGGYAGGNTAEGQAALPAERSTRPLVSFHSER